jgi:hypothetical protein
MVRRNQGPELERARPVIDSFFSHHILLSSSYMFFSYPFILLSLIVTDERSNKHAHTTMGYFEFLRMFEVEVLFVHCLDNVF